MHVYLIFWAESFGALLLAIPITAFIYGLMGDGLELKGWWVESIIALVVSAGQAGGDCVGWYFAHSSSDTGGYHGDGRIVGIIFALSFWLGYQLTHLTEWDWLEFLILGLIDAGLALGAALFFREMAAVLNGGAR